MIVRAVAVRGGRLVKGEDTLGASYYLPDEDVIEADAHGYLPQMIEGALSELDKQLRKVA